MLHVLFVSKVCPDNKADQAFIRDVQSLQSGAIRSSGRTLEARLKPMFFDEAMAKLKSFKAKDFETRIESFDEAELTHQLVRSGSL